ncbi:MAG: hypothetical protein QP772_08555, partial [Actinomycetaceae bacterium UMB1218B]|nr:hypothetical protein [Actinomycetaceae bacterium UMB1218B]
PRQAHHHHWRDRHHHQAQLRAWTRTALRAAGYYLNRFLIYVWVRRQSADICIGATTSIYWVVERY